MTAEHITKNYFQPINLCLYLLVYYDIIIADRFNNYLYYYRKIYYYPVNLEAKK